MSEVRVMFWFHWLNWIGLEKTYLICLRVFCIGNSFGKIWEHLITFWEPSQTYLFHIILDWLDVLDMMRVDMMRVKSLTFYFSYMIFMIFHTSLLILTFFNFSYVLSLDDYSRWPLKMATWVWKYECMEVG